MCGSRCKLRRASRAEVKTQRTETGDVTNSLVLAGSECNQSVDDGLDARLGDVLDERREPVGELRGQRFGQLVAGCKRVRAREQRALLVLCCICPTPPALLCYTCTAVTSSDLHLDSARVLSAVNDHSRFDRQVFDFTVQVVHESQDLLHGRVLCRVVDAKLVSASLDLRDQVVERHEPAE